MNIFQHLEKLQHFKAVAQQGSFLQAGRSLGQSQPTLIYSVNKLEETLNKKLFFRSRRGTKLTQAGIELLKFTHQIENLVQDFEMTLGLENSLSSQVRIASHTPITTALLVPVFKKIKNGNRSVAVSLHSTNSARELVDWVRESKVDLALVAEPEEIGGLECEDLMIESYGFFANRSFKNSKTLNVRSLEDLPINYVAGSITGAGVTLKKALQNHGLSLTNTFEFSDYETVKSMALYGNGIGILPKSLVRQEVLNRGIKLLKVVPALKNLGNFSLKMIYQPNSGFAEIAKSVKKEILP